MKKAAVTTQCGWRVKVARRELLKLKMVSLLKLLRDVMNLQHVCQQMIFLSSRLLRKQEPSKTLRIS